MSTRGDVDALGIKDVIENDIAALINMDIERTQVQDVEVCDVEAGGTLQEERLDNVLKALHLKKEKADGVVVRMSTVEAGRPRERASRLATWLQRLYNGQCHITRCGRP